MTVSVAIPTYNAAEYLREAIASVLAQTVPVDEIVVVDDGSTDHTREVCAAFGDPVRYFYQKNDGTMGGTARARAMLESRSDWIALLDHDDRWLPRKQERQLELAQERPEVALVFTLHSWIDPSGAPMGLPDDPVRTGDGYHDFLRRNYYSPSSALIRRDAIARCGLPDTEVGIADWAQWLAISRHFPVGYVDERLVEYRLHPTSSSANKLWMARLLPKVIKRQAERLHPACAECRRSYRLGLAHCREYAAFAYLEAFHQAAKEGRPVEAFRHLAAACSSAPRVVTRPARLAAVMKNSVVALVGGARRPLSGRPVAPGGAG